MRWGSRREGTSLTSVSGGDGLQRRVKEDLVQRLSSRDLHETSSAPAQPHERRNERTHHGVDVLSLDDPGIHENRKVVVVLHKLLHLGGKVVERVTANGVDVHRLGEGDKVGVRHLRVRVPLFVEEICRARASISSISVPQASATHPAIEGPCPGTRC